MIVFVRYQLQLCVMFGKQKLFVCLAAYPFLG